MKAINPDHGHPRARGDQGGEADDAACRTLPQPQAPVWATVLPWDQYGGGTIGWSFGVSVGARLEGGSCADLREERGIWNEQVGGVLATVVWSSDVVGENDHGLRWVSVEVPFRCWWMLARAHSV